jgi:hypothetical protein
MRASADGDACRFLYDSQRLAPAAADCLSQQMMSLLQSLPGNAGRPFGALLQRPASAGDPDIAMGPVSAF